MSKPDYMSDFEETDEGLMQRSEWRPRGGGAMTLDWAEGANLDWQDSERGGLMQRREVAEFLSVSVRTVQRMEARGTLTRVTVRGIKLAFYRASEVKALISDGKPKHILPQQIHRNTKENQILHQECNPLGHCREPAG